MSLQLRAQTAAGPVYKPITFTELCGTQTVTLSATSININVSIGGSDQNEATESTLESEYTESVGYCRRVND